MGRGKESLGLEVPQLRSLNDVKNHINSRQAAYRKAFRKLGENASSVQGWTEVRTSASGYVEKINHSLTATQTPSIFTGTGFCGEVSAALYDVLTSLVSDTLTVEVVKIGTDMNKENWGRRDYRLRDESGNHLLLMVEDKNTHKRLLIDGTYGQIDHTKTGELLVFEEKDFDQYYSVLNGAKGLKIINEEERNAFRDDIEPLHRDDMGALVAVFLQSGI